ncbi:MAG: hypothetical protein WDO19_15695 [Bacteroidota bacterium]
MEKEADSMGAKALNTTIQCYGPDEEEKLYHAFRQGSLQESLGCKVSLTMPLPVIL